MSRDLTLEQVADFAGKLPERSVIFANYEDVSLVARAFLVARRADLDVQYHPYIVPGELCARSPYALATGENGWWLP